MSKVIVIGGGAAGMMAAYAASGNGHEVTLLEKNEKLGKKIYITGKGRCNVTNAGDMEQLFANVVRNPKFLYSSFYSFDNQALMKFMEEFGCKLKIERGDRVFPVSDHSSDVIAACKRALDKRNVRVLLNTTVSKLLIKEETNPQTYGVVLANHEELFADSVILATGGLSYPTTGSTGDGHRMALESGHAVTECTPSLVPFNIKENWVQELQGLSLKNVSLSLLQGKKPSYQGFGEMLFTHFGISGPLVLSASSYYNKSKECTISIDLKPALSKEQLDKRLLREFEEHINCQFKNALHDLFPGRLIPIMIRQSEIDPEKKVHDITKAERTVLVERIKNLTMTVAGTRGYHEAIITKGGVNIKDINPSNLESKKIKNLYFAGEILDLDALTGGYNLQIAWSTGWLSGDSVL